MLQDSQATGSVFQMDPSQSSMGEESSSGATLMQPPAKRVRGRTKCRNIHWLPEGHKLRLQLNSKGQIIGRNSSKLSNFCGTLVRDERFFRLDALRWKAVSEATREHAWQTIQMKFQVQPVMRSIVMTSLSKKWKDYKASLKKKFYKPGATDAENFARVPPDVSEDQWYTLVQYWNSDEGKKRSATNKANRSAQVLSHTAGTKSFARLAAEEKAKNNEIEPTRAEIFIKTHTRRDGTPVNIVAANKIRQIQDLLNEAPSISQDNTGQEDVFSQVLGPEHPGRVRAYGLGPTPNGLLEHSSASHSNASSQDSLDRLKYLEEQMATKDAQIQALELRIQTLETLLQAVLDRDRQALAHSSVDPSMPVEEGSTSTHLSLLDHGPHVKT